jgi:hypothetical protein
MGLGLVVKGKSPGRRRLYDHSWGMNLKGWKIVIRARRRENGIDEE